MYALSMEVPQLFYLALHLGVESSDLVLEPLDLDVLLLHLLRHLGLQLRRCVLIRKKI